MERSLLPISPARQTAYQVLFQVESGGRFAVDLLQSPAVSALAEVDRNLTTELVMGVLRWRGELDYWIERLSAKPVRYFDPEVAILLRLGIYQIRFLQRIPKSAAVDDAVELTKRARKRSAAGLVNAVLRKCPSPRPRGAAEGSSRSRPGDDESIRRSFPTWLFTRWEQQFGFEGAMALARQSNNVPPTTLRVCGETREAVYQMLAREGVETLPGRYARGALIVQSGNVQSTETFRRGHAAIQDEASQLVGELLAPRPGDLVLDLCAAPGVKTGQLATALEKGLLIACDLSARRLRAMEKVMRPPIPPEVRFYRVRLDASDGLPF